MSDNILDDIVKAYCATKIQREHILNQNGANMVYNHGRDIANKLGVGNPPQGVPNANLGITPFPSPVTNNNVSLTEPPKKSLGPWATAAIAAAAALGGAGMATALPWYMNKPTTQVQPADPATTFGQVEIDVR